MLLFLMFPPAAHQLQQTHLKKAQRSALQLLLTLLSAFFFQGRAATFDLTL